MINLFQPQVGAEELAAIAETFEDKWLGHGPRTQAFEAAFAEHIDVPAEHVVFINSGTSGLFLALESLDLKDGDEVVLPSLSFVAAANAVLSCGARPVFCDVDPRTLNPTVEGHRAGAHAPDQGSDRPALRGAHPVTSSASRTVAGSWASHSSRTPPARWPPGWTAGPWAPSVTSPCGASTP
ncbi:DegT/DnrJ/EryC1/StrS family aminotransferase [Streptomyces sp. KL116D]|uniref:DegT/DnrJ/EryC1/StrS family aminotransferase n=1 Tax=Streptomyces sp. KL116D TaxID=3045152 RepID=UPI0035568B47